MVVLPRMRSLTKLDPNKATHHFAEIYGLFRHRVAHRIPILQEIEPKHTLQWHHGPPALRSRIWTVRLDQGKQTPSRLHCIHICQTHFRHACLTLAPCKLGKAGCFGIERAHCRIADAYQITSKTVGFSDAPPLQQIMLSKMAHQILPGPSHLFVTAC
jgi:hypothetical protein